MDKITSKQPNDLKSTTKLSSKEELKEHEDVVLEKKTETKENSKTTRIEIEKISNGYLLCKTVSIWKKHPKKDESSWEELENSKTYFPKYPDIHTDVVDLDEFKI